MWISLNPHLFFLRLTQEGIVIPILQMWVLRLRERRGLLRDVWQVNGRADTQ